ncbi:MAG TPA: dethiobiotin synthase [Dissulfurispiraceae bacterium]|nr:dethiobiotin synthase [Dissulfurispiraceae bacterium]
MGKGIFVTGTDTGVGKTVIAAALILAAQQEGLRVAVLKPVETGCRRENGELLPADGLFLQRIAGHTTVLDDVVPLRYETPVAPLVAAWIEEKVPDVKSLLVVFERLRNEFDFVVVEGAGGLLVPISEALSGAAGEFYFMRDLARDFGLPLVIVGRAGLGTINHTLLSVHEAESAGIRVAGVVLNQSEPISDTASETNATVLRKILAGPVFGVFRYLTEKTASSMDAASKEIDLGRLVRIAQSL